MNKNNSFDSNGRLEWLDVLKCIVMYLVVVGHAVPKGTNGDCEKKSLCYQ